MRLDLTRAFVTDGFDKPIDESVIPGEELSLWSDGRVESPVSVTGHLFNRAGILHLHLDVAYTVVGACDRCCEPVKMSRTAPIRVILVKEKQDEDNDELIQVSGDLFEVDPLISESILLDAPGKLLCEEDCRGLCPMCGQNLNEKKCDCRQTQSPFDILKQQFND